MAYYSYKLYCSFFFKDRGAKKARAFCFDQNMTGNECILNYPVFSHKIASLTVFLSNVSISGLQGFSKKWLQPQFGCI